MRTAAEIRLRQSDEESELLSWFDSVWFGYWAGDQDEPIETRRYIPLPSDWAQSVLRIINADVDCEFIEKAVETAMFARQVEHRNRFRYFCGICWREIDRRQEIAMELISVDDVEV